MELARDMVLRKMFDVVLNIYETRGVLRKREIQKNVVQISGGEKSRERIFQSSHCPVANVRVERVGLSRIHL